MTGVRTDLAWPDRNHIVEGDRPILVACSALKQEFALAAEGANPWNEAVWIDSGLHNHPERLHMQLQKAIDAIPGRQRTVLLGFGFCGNGLVGIEARERTLVLPLACDCATMLMGSHAKREGVGGDAYFLTEGYYRYERSIFYEYTHYQKRYGEARAKKIIGAMMAHYRKIALIDTGAYEVEALRSRVEPHAKEIGLQVVVVPGDLGLLRGLVKGDWEREKYLVVAPGGAIRLEDSLRAGGRDSRR